MKINRNGDEIEDRDKNSILLYIPIHDGPTLIYDGKVSAYLYE